MGEAPDAAGAPEPRFRRAGGLNASEAVLAALSDRAFLSLWSYPNVYKEPGKELTDLLVVFGDDVILFSDKACAYPENVAEDLAWRRWYRRAIAKSAHQIHQAERWLRANPERLFLDARCTDRVPIALPPPDRLRLHRVCVATGAAAHRQAAVGQPSLAIDFGVEGDAAPMRIGRVAEAPGGLLHIFDESSLTTLFEELDTAPDFIGYLRAKEALAEAGAWRGAESELDVLAIYLWNNRSFPAQAGAFVFQPNMWAQVVAEPAFRNGKQANGVSAFWDRLIELVNGFYVAQTLEYGNDVDIGPYEFMMRCMAAEPRFQRRVLSDLILERAERAREGWVGSCLPSSDPAVMYVTLIGPGPEPGGDRDAYRRRRTVELYARCQSAKVVNPHVQLFIGLGLDARGVLPSSQDFLYFDTSDWTEVEMAEARAVQARTGYFDAARAQVRRVQADEYPQA